MSSHDCVTQVTISIETGISLSCPICAKDGKEELVVYMDGVEYVLISKCTVE